MVPRHLLNVLKGLIDADGPGTLDLRGARVVVGPSRDPIPGDMLEWMQLVSLGLVAGERGLLLLTEEGRAHAAKLAEGRVREGTY